MRITALTSLAIMTLACVVDARAQVCSLPLLIVEENGKVSAGSKDLVRAAAEAGLPLRVSWSLDFDHDGKADLIHWADAVFVTEFEGEVFAQIAEIRRQTPVRGQHHVELSEAPQRWRASIGSDGILEGAFDETGKPAKIHVRVTMCVDPRVPRENLPEGVRERISAQRR